MNQEIEIEFKTLLTEEAFNTLKNKLPFPKKAVQQINYYFETNDFTMKKQQSALRIREKSGTYTLTLKQPHKEGILETHDRLSEEEFASWLDGRPVQKPHIGKQLQSMDIQFDQLIYYGALATKRTSFEEDSILYVLDQSEYFGETDYELEIESPTFVAGEVAFHDLLQQFKVDKQPPITKIERFFRALQNEK